MMVLHPWVVKVIAPAALSWLDTLKDVNLTAIYAFSDDKSSQHSFLLSVFDSVKVCDAIIKAHGAILVWNERLNKHSCWKT